MRPGQIKNSPLIFLGLLMVLAGVGLAAVFYAGWRATAAEPSERDSYKFIAKPCWFDADWTASIRCGELRTPEFTGRFFLPVVILQDSSAERRPDPVVYLQGGPGAGARLHTEGIKHWLRWQRYAGLKRDIILLDTRGTGASQPALVCAQYNRLNQSLLNRDVSLTEELAQGFKVTAECFAQLQDSNATLSPEHFGSRQSAQDVRALMALLDYPEWNILGVSYGTRLALEIARQEALDPQPVRLKSMVLDSIYPAGFGGVQTWPEVLDSAFERFFAGCAQQASCQQARKDPTQPLSEQLQTTLAQLREQPLSLTLRRWDGEAPVEFVVNDHRFLSAAFAAIYDPADWVNIIHGLNGVAEHKRAKLLPLIEPFINNSMSADFNSLAFSAIDCADNSIQTEQYYQTQVERYPLLQAYTRDQWRYQICHGLAPSQPLKPSEPLVPSLILSGGLDPVTPSAWAREVNARWELSQLLVVEHMAHALLSSELCLLPLLGEFYDNPQKPFRGCAESRSAAK